MKININEVLEVYLGAGEKGGYQPAGPENRLKETFPENWPELEEAIQPYLNFEGCNIFEYQDLAQAAKAFEIKIKENYPELSEIVARSLANRFTYNWR